MKLKKLLKSLNIDISDSVDMVISNVTSDSRKCDSNSLYVNLHNDYLFDAVKRGVKVIVSDKYINYLDKIVIYVKDIKRFYYEALRKFYNINNGYKIGVTGTCGKTTTVTLLYESLKINGNNCLLISSNGNYIYMNNQEEYYETKNTTPDIETIYELIDKYDYDYIIIEVSSQGLASNRLEGIVFDMCVFLNLSTDHLDYHKTISNYLNSKLKLFDQLKNDGVCLINYHCKFKKLFDLKNLSFYTFGVGEGDYSIFYEKHDFETMKVYFKDKYSSTLLTGAYNAENISAVYAVINLLKINSNCLVNCLNNGFKVKGRFEVVNYCNNKIVIDFAHTEKELEALLNYVNDFPFNKRYIVIGCGGDRDKSKRPIFGKLSVQFADEVIFTEDNSRSELVTDIINNMTNNLNKKNYNIIINRFDAIKRGIKLLKENDILLIIGKGIDKTNINNRLITDREIVEEVIYDDIK